MEVCKIYTTALIYDGSSTHLSVPTTLVSQSTHPHVKVLSDITKFRQFLKSITEIHRITNVVLHTNDATTLNILEYVNGHERYRDLTFISTLSYSSSVREYAKTLSFPTVKFASTSHMFALPVVLLYLMEIVECDDKVEVVFDSEVITRRELKRAIASKGLTSRCILTEVESLYSLNRPLNQTILLCSNVSIDQLNSNSTNRVYTYNCCPQLPIHKKSFYSNVALCIPVSQKTSYVSPSVRCALTLLSCGDFSSLVRIYFNDDMEHQNDFGLIVSL